MKNNEILEFWEKCSPNDKIPIFCLEHGANPNQKVTLPEYHCSALHVALAGFKLPDKDVKALIKAFLIHGASTDVKDSNGVTVLQMAEQKQPCCVSLLKSKAVKAYRKPVSKPSTIRAAQKPVVQIVPIEESVLDGIRRHQMMLMDSIDWSDFPELATGGLLGMIG